MVFKKKKAENENQPCVAKGTYMRLSGEGHFHHLLLWQTKIKNISEDLLEHLL